MYLALFAFIALFSCDNSDENSMTENINPQGSDLMVYGITAMNELVYFNSNNPKTFTSKTAVTGVTSGEKLLSIDFRPATGELYALSNASKLYIINTSNASARVVSSTAFTPMISGTIASIDFNPTVDRIRLVSNTGQNLRLHPETGAVAATDININGTDFKSFSYPLEGVKWLNDLKTGGSSDQSLIFTAPHSNIALINGMLPSGKTVTVSGSTPNPPLQLAIEVKQWLKESGIELSGKAVTNSQLETEGKQALAAPKNNILLIYQSPTLDKIVYWFLRKSINLYGETLIKTLGKEKKGNSSFKSGVAYLKEFWKSKGINPNMINFADGSGLSPQNYVAAKAEVQALLYAKKQSWFEAYYDGFPVQDNGMKMKSGTTRDTKSFAGYHTAKDGKKYVFSIIINNYQGSGNTELQKILNVLK